MKLTDARNLFRKCQERGEAAFIIRKHCWVDHKERKFTCALVLNLLMGKGHLKNNFAPSAKPGSFIWHCNDEEERSCEIVVIPEKDGSISATAISAWRKI